MPSIPFMDKYYLRENMSKIKTTFKNLSHIVSVLVLFLSLVSVLYTPQKVVAAPTGLPSGFSTTTVTNSGLGTPTGIKFAPDGRMFVLDLYGNIRIYTEGVGFNATNFGSVPVDATGDRGLLGGTFDSDFANNPYLYIHYVAPDDTIKIGRFNASSDVGTNFTNIYSSPTQAGFQHAGGGITHANDGMLYFGIGDSGTPTNSQSLSNVHGKIHRINRNGSIPASNPFVNQPGVPSSIYTYGMRNPFRMHTDKLTGAIYVGDVGFNTWEEVNLVQSGKNYGWAAQEGPCTQACAYENPVYWYPHQFGTNNTNDASIVLGPVYRGNAYPASYQGKAFISDYVQGFLRNINPTTTSNAYTTFSTGNGSVIDMDVGTNGKLYYVTIFSPTIYRVDYSGGVVNNPPSAVASANTLSGPAPLTVNFSSAGSIDPEAQNLSYSWNFGDGTTSTNANPTKTYTNNGQYNVTLVVSDGVNSTPSNGLIVRVGALPIVTISNPGPSTTFRGGDTINYSATAVDKNGQPLTGNSLSTTVILHHSDHTHPFLGPISGGSGSFVIPKTGELSADIWYDIIVTATDSNGVTGSANRIIQPIKAMLTVNTSPAGLNVVLDGSNHVIPPTVQGVAGLTRSVQAPSPQLFNGQQYVFDRWSDGGAQTHSFDFPSTDTTLTAIYVPSNSNVNYTNLIANPSFESVTLGNPDGWTYSKWGTNNTAMTISNDAVTGINSAYLSTTSYTIGEGRLYHNPVTVAPNTVHPIRYSYKSDVQTKAVADITLLDGTHQFIWLGINQPSASWREQNWTLNTPANAKYAVISLYLTSAGYFQVDDVNLLAPSVTPPTVIAPVITMSATTPTITAGQSTTLNWSVSGTTPVCTASGAWTGTQASSGSLVVSPTTTSTYTLTCTNSLGTDTKFVTVTVNPVVPPVVNLIANGTLFDIPFGSTVPTGWYKGDWGSNTAVYAREIFGHNDITSISLTLSNFVNGDAKWFFEPVTVNPGQLYHYTMWYKASSTFETVVEYTLSDNTKSYLSLGTTSVANDWTEYHEHIIPPVGCVKVSIAHVLKSDGALYLDDFSLDTNLNI